MRLSRSYITDFTLQQLQECVISFAFTPAGRIVQYYSHVLHAMRDQPKCQSGCSVALHGCLSLDREQCYQ